MTDSELKYAIKVVKAAKKLGVIRMKLGSLEFELGRDEPRLRQVPLKISRKNIAAADERNRLQMDLNDANDDLSVMHVEDPSGFERALIDKELDDDGTGGDQLEEAQTF